MPDAVWIEGNNHFPNSWGYFVPGANFSPCLQISWGFCHLTSPACWETSEQQLCSPAYQSTPVYRNASTDLLQFDYIPFSWWSASALNSIMAGVDPPEKCTSNSLPARCQTAPCNPSSLWLPKPWFLFCWRMVMTFVFFRLSGIYLDHPIKLLEWPHGVTTWHLLHPYWVHAQFDGLWVQFVQWEPLTLFPSNAILMQTWKLWGQNLVLRPRQLYVAFSCTLLLINFHDWSIKP